MENIAIKKVARSLRVGNGRCPNGHSLMSEKKMLDGERAIHCIARLAGRSGTIYLNPFYGRFAYETDLALGKGDVVELFCPSCETSLTVDTTCRLCNIPMFGVHLPDGGVVEACPKIGCHNHRLTIIDLDAQLERMYVDETKVQM